MSGRGAGKPICEVTPITAFLLPDENSPQGNTYFSGYLCESADLPVFLYLLTQVSPPESVTCIIQLLIEYFYLIIFVHVYMGLPLSLAGVGAVLGLEEQKLKEGRDLIRYFCVPCKATKSNGGRTRNLPEHDPEKWELFMFYNQRDVEVEQSIQKKLQHFPVPEFVWDEFWLDQEINDRGILLDLTLVKNAIALDEISKDKLSDAMKDLTELENPNSVAQMKQWLSDQGVEAESLGKKDVAKMIADDNIDEDVTEALRLRQQLAKSSVKKYQAMQTAVCKDGRARLRNWLWVTADPWEHLKPWALSKWG